VRCTGPAAVPWGLLCVAAAVRRHWGRVLLAWGGEPPRGGAVAAARSRCPMCRPSPPACALSVSAWRHRRHRWQHRAPRVGHRPTAGLARTATTQSVHPARACRRRWTPAACRPVRRRWALPWARCSCTARPARRPATAGPWPRAAAAPGGAARARVCVCVCLVRVRACVRACACAGFCASAGYCAAVWPCTLARHQGARSQPDAPPSLMCTCARPRTHAQVPARVQQEPALRVLPHGRGPGHGGHHARAALLAHTAGGWCHTRSTWRVLRVPWPFPEAGTGCALTLHPCHP